MGILEEGGPIITGMQKKLCFDLTHKVASIEPIMKFIQKT
jgi:hypothetical protein